MLEEQRAGSDAAVNGGAAPPGAFRDPVTWAIAGAVFGAYATLSLFRLLTLAPMSWDLGIYTEYVKQFANLRAPVVDVRGAGFNLLGDHFQPVVALIAPFFRIFPSPATLLVAQALLIAVSVFPVVSAGFAVLGGPAAAGPPGPPGAGPGRQAGRGGPAGETRPGRGAARAVGLAYGFSWGLQQMIDFDFHEIAFAVPLLAFSLSAFVRGRWRACAAWALPLVFVKEDQGFTVAALGLLMLAAGWRAASRARRGKPPAAARGSGAARIRLGFGTWPGKRGGMLLVVWGLAWSVLAITVIIPHFNPQHHYYYWKDGGVAGPGGPFSVSGLVAQPFHGWAEKLQTSVLLLLPTAFIALGSPVALVALPSIALRFFSTNTSYWGTIWHYNATVMPILFLAAVEVMGRWHALPADGGVPLDSGGPGCDGGQAGRGGPGYGGGPAGRGAAARASGAVAAGFGRLRGQVRSAAARHGPAMMVAAACVFAFQFPLANLWHGATYQISPHVSAAETAVARVPSGATVQTTLDLLAPLAARTDTFWIGNPGNPATEYVVFDGLNSGYSPAPPNVPAFIRQLFPKDAYREVFASDDVYVFKRG